MIWRVRANRGRPREIWRHPLLGTFVDLADALERLDRLEIRPDDLRFDARRFSEDEFQAKMKPFLFCEGRSTFPDAAPQSLSDWE